MSKNDFEDIYESVENGKTSNLSSISYLFSILITIFYSFSTFYNFNIHKIFNILHNIENILSFSHNIDYILIFSHKFKVKIKNFNINFLLKSTLIFNFKNF